MQELLFAYGTLQCPEIQQALFGRLLRGDLDILKGYRKEWIGLNPDLSNGDYQHIYPIAIPSDRNTDVIEGMVYELTPEELLKADEYEGSSYRRVQVALKSEKKCWLYENAS